MRHRRIGGLVVAVTAVLIAAAGVFALVRSTPSESGVEFETEPFRR